ncbi:hypothetical protein X797_008242 [Metarhizium robertsii]|uniref:Uncharacterized protein n=2 Tax=Metarhizium robertsii TaxID=568076 RepID=E9F9L1_METRA|nr:uncharacterized protein MAA_08960 [Metarhizium robertsii ARSEF 23]EFY95504.1 hypothetical protein MAA_08960 [Metarhizium robertsii ARSEF 23]EXU98768.1 hypothetical protein X797_008242 [Metarhizium robertsii]
MSDYKPTEHNGLKKDGTPDKRVGTGEFAYGKVDPHIAGMEGAKAAARGSSGSSDGSSSGGAGGSGGDYKPTEHGGLRKDGKPDGRVKGN